MADDELNPLGTPTANYGWTKPTVGADADVWGGMLNADLDGIDTTVHTVSGVANAAYPASNPSGYQTAAQVTAALSPYALTTSLASYLALSGGTMTGPLTPAGIVGVSNGSNAAAGQIGEYLISDIASGAAVGLGNGVTVNVTSLSLTAGDWDVWVNGAFSGGATASVLGLIVSITTTSAGVNTSASGTTRWASPSASNTLFANGNMTLVAGPVRLSLAATTTVYYTATANFTVSAAAYGSIQARRRR